MNTTNLTTKEKLQIIGAKIGEYQIKQSKARFTGNWQDYKIARDAEQMALKEFIRLKRIYIREKKKGLYAVEK